MSLEELNEKLHGRDVHLDRGEQQTPFDPGRGAADTRVEEGFATTESWRSAAQEEALAKERLFAGAKKRKRRYLIFAVVGLVTVILLLGGVFLKIRSMLFQEERIEVALSGPQSVASAEETTFTITYANKNWGDLRDVTIVFSYPDSFRLQQKDGLSPNGASVEIPLGTLEAGSDGKTIVSGKFYGSKGDLVYLNAVLRYTPKSIAGVFEKKVQLGVNVASSPLALEITAPLEVATGQDIEYVIDYANMSDTAFSNLRLKMEYPEGFRFVSAEPRSSEGETLWYIGNLSPYGKGKVVVRGIMTGSRAEHKRIQGRLGYFQGDGNFLSYTEHERQTKIVTSPLFIAQTINGLTGSTVNVGEDLSYSIKYRNDGNIGLRDVIVTVEIDSEMLEMEKLLLQKGSYDAARKMIVWKAADIPALSRLDPGEEGEISFKVPVKTKLPSEKRNLTLRSIAKIDSPDVPTPLGANKVIGSNALYVKLHSPVSLEAHALYSDTTFQNSGPVPPKVGQETTYTVRVKITNPLNDVKQARVSFVLPGGIRYGGKFSPNTDTVIFNERTNELLWEIGALAANGNASRELFFQIHVTPGPQQAKSSLLLLQSATFTGRDLFTDQEARAEVKAVDNSLKHDKMYANVNGTVQGPDEGTNPQ
ncbi:MAG: hypothetical protein HYV45_01915 [Candidatus Moranbacteria bacterium]|nr:hypothetical protein [Candidatus Moranbacteria bacterium]